DRRAALRRPRPRGESTDHTETTIFGPVRAVASTPDLTATLALVDAQTTSDRGLVCEPRRRRLRAVGNVIMEPRVHAALVERLRAAHGVGRMLVLPNAWDAGSARLIEASGAEAIATSSAAMAWALGYADGERLPLDALVAVIATITRCVSAPVTVDFERGYSDDPAAVAAAVLRVIGAGAVGVNLEDGSGPPELLAKKIAAVRSAVAAHGADLFINARTDVVLRGLVPSARAVEETLARARLYAEAGCDGLFVPKIAALDEIEAIVRGIALPLNVMAVPGLAPIAELRRRGVRRLSVGPGLAECALTAARRGCVELLEHGTYEALFASDVTYPEMNGLFAKR
ncbi:MAG: isocitrate lyase/phosphoenolpyruvate mutase family protein, partial [Byssovorax sp.]